MPAYDLTPKASCVCAKVHAFRSMGGKGMELVCTLAAASTEQPEACREYKRVSHHRINEGDTHTSTLLA